jgi:hypothetical protein
VIWNHAIIAILMQFYALVNDEIVSVGNDLIDLLTTVFVSELGFHLFHIPDWCEGQVTEYLVATFGDYFTDVKM